MAEHAEAERAPGAPDRQILDRAVAESVPLIGATVAIVYGLLGVAHLLLAPPAVMRVMLPIAAATALLGLGTALALRSREVPARWGSPIVAGFVLVVLGNVFVHATLLPRPGFGIHYAIAAMGVGLLLLDRRWLVTLEATTVAAWVWLAARHWSDDPVWTDASTGVGFGVAIGWLMRNVRARNLVRLAQAREARESLEAASRTRETWLRRHAEQLQHLVTSPALLAGDWRTLVREAVDVGAEAFRADRASVWLYSDDRQRCVLVDRYMAETGRHDAGLEVPVSRYPAYHALLERERVIDAHDARTDPRIAELRADFIEPLGIGSMLDAPIRSGGRLVGVLGHARRGGPRVWTVDEVNLAASVAEVIGIAIQSAERVRGEEQRRELEARMQEAVRLESLGVLAGGVAHDFNNVLATILGNAELLLDELPEGDAHRCAVEIERAGRRGADFAQKMLAYAGRATFVEAESVDLVAIASEMARVALPPGTEGVQLASELPDTPVPAVGDPVQIQQVVLNLLTNAVDAVRDRGGRIAVRAGLCDVDAAELERCALRGDATPGRYAFVEVADDGPGMSEEIAARIFDPFFTTKFRGRGLGLAATHGIVRAHRGTICVTTSPGGGTTMRLMLPQSDASPPERAAPLPRAARSGRGDVLVVDDEQAVRRVARRMLERAGFRVIEAEGSRAAHEAFGREGERLRAALLDVTMPDGDGVELARWLRSQAPGLPILLMTGYDVSAATGRLGPDPRSGYLHKPFRASALLDALHTVLGDDEDDASEKPPDAL